MVKAVIFDMDGLIIDSEPFHSQSWEILLKQFGKTPIYNQHGLVHNAGIAGTYKMIQEKYQLDVDSQIIRRKKRRIYSTLIKTQVTPKVGFFELIDLLKEQKIKIALASNTNRRQVLLILNNLNIKHLFDAIVGPSTTRKHKPSPDIYLATARKLKVKANECIVLEDSETGIIAGKEANMKVIAVPNEYTKHQDLSRADLIVNSLMDIKWSTISKL